MPNLTLRSRFTRHASVVKYDRHPRCTVPGCIRHVHHFGAALCGRHTDRRRLNGDVNASSITTAELRTFSGYIDEGMRRFDRTPAYQVALRRCRDLMNFNAPMSDGWARYLAACMQSLRCKRGKVIEPADVLLVILCFYGFMQAHPQRLPNTDSYFIGLGRAVTRLGPVPGRRNRPQKAAAIGAGRYIASQLGQFAVLFLKHWGELHRREAIKREREDAALADFRLPDACAAV
jgi:hypothetical protein